GGAAAFAVEVQGEERLAVVQEIERNPSPEVVAEVITQIRRAVALEHDVEIHAIRLIKMLSLPRTSSGKVQRHACREAFSARALEIVAEWTRQIDAAPPVDQLPPSAVPPAEPPRDRAPVQSVARSRGEIAAWLASKIAGPLGIRAEEIDTRHPLAGFGIGSL